MFQNILITSKILSYLPDQKDRLSLTQVSKLSVNQAWIGLEEIKLSSIVSLTMLLSLIKNSPNYAHLNQSLITLEIDRAGEKPVLKSQSISESFPQNLENLIFQNFHKYECLLIKFLSDLPPKLAHLGINFIGEGLILKPTVDKLINNISNCPITLQKFNLNEVDCLPKLKEKPVMAFFDHRAAKRHVSQEENLEGHLQR